MAKSPSHQLGEAIGDNFELMMINYLRPYVEAKGLYLDYRHPRDARDGAKEVTGIDGNGNKHKLDIVIEENGSETVMGKPKAFIEMAWRRYKKHSKNKVQEISGAIIPLIDKYADEMPFYSAVLSGDFTPNSIVQLESQGFHVLYFTYEEMCALYESIGISIRTEEYTSERELTEIAGRVVSLTEREKHQLQQSFEEAFVDRLTSYRDALIRVLAQHITEIVIIPMHGASTLLSTVDEAVNFIMKYDESTNEPIMCYEIIVRYNTEVEYKMRCKDKRMAIQFLNRYK